MTFIRFWRIWFIATVGIVAICLIGSVWGSVPLAQFFPLSFNRFYVSYWWLCLLLGLSVSSLLGLALVLFDASFSLSSRLIWAAVIIPFSPMQFPFIGYWLYRIERPQFLNQRAMASKR